MTARPHSPPPRDPRELPALAPLIGERRWCCWSWERVEKHGAVKWTKPPRNADGRMSRNNIQSDWDEFDPCWTRVQAGGADGVGFMLQDLPGAALAAIDLDDVRNPLNGELLDWAEQIVAEAGSYTEITPSGEGLRVLGTAGGISKMHRKIAHPDGGSFELYVSCERFITLSGHVNGHDQLADITDVMLQLEVIGGPKPNGHDTENDAAAGDGEPLDIGELSLPVVELLTQGTLDGKPVRHRGKAFARLVRALRTAAKGDFTVVLATLMAHPGGVQSKFAGRLEAELRRFWGKIEEAEAEAVNPSAPYATAQLFLTLRYNVDNLPTLHRHRGGFYAWNGAAYPEIGDAEMRAQVYAWLSGCVAPARLNTHTVNGIIDALRAAAHLTETIAAPAWLDGRTEPDPAGLIAVANGLLDLPSGELMPHTPALFTHNALPFAFDDSAPEPAEWLKFLHQLWSNDAEAIATLQEVFGYMLTADTSHQKAFLLVGPKRSGKGTIGRVLTRLIGAGNVVAPTLAGLGTNFGLQPLISKRVGIISDARLGGRADQAVIAERMLSITGEDGITIDRKFKEAWTGRLGVRFLVLTNELPRLSDASGALASRFIVLVLTRSFYGAEDRGLLGKLVKELPGVLNWAIAGWRRLQRRGHFRQPTSAAEAVAQFEDLGSPIGAFLRDRCIVDPGRSESVDRLYRAWKGWCSQQRREPGDHQAFGRDLRAAVPGLGMSQPRVRGKRVRHYEGIGLKE